MKPRDLQPGDVIVHPALASGPEGAVVIHAMRVIPTPSPLAGSVAYRYRYASNPEGIDWTGFLADDQEVHLMARGVAQVDPDIRGLLPG